ncbi:MAG: hypothetical protein HPPSJP_3510 [Candidatus Hepatoplasma scabrum]|nr:MAG: hypothetical protein HPPSJP_3510 [Candidatus Hepatoplasma sp.]
MDSFAAWFTGTFLATLSIVTSIMAFIGIFYAIWDFKYRKDSNINLRKDIDEDIIKNFYLFLEGIKEKNKMKNSKADIKLLTYFGSPITRRRYRDSLKKIKKLNFDHRLIFEQFKNYERIKDDFYIRKNVTFNNFAMKNKIIEQKINNKNELIFILVLFNIALFTETLALINIDNNKYEKIYKYIYKICK